MNNIYRLSMLPLNRHDEDFVRIYDNTKEAVERLNIYLFDFVDSIGILKEKLEELTGKDDPTVLSETQDKIGYMKEKIQTLCVDMSLIATEMPEFIELHEVPLSGN